MGQISYSTALFNPYDFCNSVKLISKQIKLDAVELGTNCIACSGFSSSIIVGAISFETGLPVVLVRKTNDSSHSTFDLEYSDILEKLNAVFVDDFIATGETVIRVRDRIERNTKITGKLLKVYLYQSYGGPYTFHRHSEDYSIGVWRQEEK